MTLKAFLEYEIQSSWWAGLVAWGWCQKLVARYFLWKTRRKYSRYFDRKFARVYEDLLRNRIQSVEL